MKTKFNLRDKVYYMHHNKILVGLIQEIKTHQKVAFRNLDVECFLKPENENTIIYYVRSLNELSNEFIYSDAHEKKESELFISKKNLLESL